MASNRSTPQTEAGDLTTDIAAKLISFGLPPWAAQRYAAIWVKEVQTNGFEILATEKERDRRHTSRLENAVKDMAAGKSRPGA